MLTRGHASATGWPSASTSRRARAGRGADARAAGRAAPRRSWPARASRRSTATSPRPAQALLMQPWWLDWTAGLFPVILVVFLLRSFLFEPFKIPSGSMMPTLLVGDLILVNKYHYGVRLPVINKKIIANNDPQRGDVMVFRYPVDPQHRLHQARRRRARRRGRLPATSSSSSTASRCRPTPLRRVLRRGQPALRAAVQREARRRRAPHPGRSAAQRRSTARAAPLSAFARTAATVPRA